MDETAFAGTLIEAPAMRAEALAEPEADKKTLLLMAVASGLIVANNYYAQPLVGPISHALGMSPAAAGLIVTMTQLGYALGLVFLVPLGDLQENRRLIVTLTGVLVFALLGAAFSPTPPVLLAFALAMGATTVAVQILVPFAAHLAPDHSRGRVVGGVMSGLMLGIMLARPVSSVVMQISSWRVIFIASAVMMAVLAVVMIRQLPTRRPKSNLKYWSLIASMKQLALETPILQRRSFYQAFMFGAFSVFWTAVPLYLAGAAYHMSQAGIALFALAGVAGAVASPIAGRVADKGLMRPATGFAMTCGVIAFLLSRLAPAGSWLGIGLLVFTAILLDFGVSANLTLGQRAIFALPGELRSRVNGIYIATFFLGGAAGSAVGGWAFAHGGWSLTSWIGAALPFLGLMAFLTEFRGRQASVTA